MARKIEGAIRLTGGKGVLKAGDERKLAEADLPKESLKALQDRGAITGFHVDVEEGEDVPIRSLKEFLADKPLEEVEQLAAADDRPSSRPIYEARLRELNK